MKHHLDLYELLDTLFQIQLFPYSVPHIATNMTKWAILSTLILTRARVCIEKNIIISNASQQILPNISDRKESFACK